MNLQENITNVVCNIEQKFNYTKDNVLCFSIATQPNFLMWSAALALNKDLGTQAREIALENAQEEYFGVMGEGCHALLSMEFFKQLGNPTIKHFEKTEQEVKEIYKYMDNEIVLLTLIACIEICSPIMMKKICATMENHGATDFHYIDVHKVADNDTDGHGQKFVQALMMENPNPSDVELGISLFINFFSKIFK